MRGGSNEDLASISQNGTTASQAIAADTYFYLNDSLVRSKIAIASGDTFTLNTNYEVVTAGALNELVTKMKNTTPFSFGVDGSGNYGYIKAGADTVTPFRNPLGDATASDVLAGKSFANAIADNIAGLMTNNGAVSQALNCGGSYTIPAGYHNGSGSVTANSLASQTIADAIAANILNTKTAWVNGSKITGTMTNRGNVSQTLSYLGDSYKVPAGYHAGSGTVTGATGSYRQHTNSSWLVKSTAPGTKDSSTLTAGHSGLVIGACSIAGTSWSSGNVSCKLYVNGTAKNPNWSPSDSDAYSKMYVFISAIGVNQKAYIRIVDTVAPGSWLACNYVLFTVY